MLFYSNLYLFKTLNEISFVTLKFNNNFIKVFHRILSEENNETNFEIFILVNKYIISKSFKAQNYIEFIWN